MSSMYEQAPALSLHRRIHAHIRWSTECIHVSRYNLTSTLSHSPPIASVSPFLDQYDEIIPHHCPDAIFLQTKFQHACVGDIRTQMAPIRCLLIHSLTHSLTHSPTHATDSLTGSYSRVQVTSLSSLDVARRANRKVYDPVHAYG